MLPRKVTETKLKYKLNTNGVCVHSTKEYSLSRILLYSIFWYNQTCQAGRVNKLFADWFTRQFVMRICCLRLKCSTCAEDAIKGPCTWSPKFHMHCFYFYFFYTSSFPIKMFVTNEKTQKIEQFQIFFYDRRKFWRQCVNGTDTTWGPIYF